jgi:hypothetical protein
MNIVLQFLQRMWIIYINSGHAFKSFVTLWVEDLDTSLQLKYNIFIFSLSPFLKLLCRTFPLSCVKDFHLQHFSHRILFYRTSMTIFLMHSLHMYCKWTLCSTENSSNMHWSTLYEMQQISCSSHSSRHDDAALNRLV